MAKNRRTMNAVSRTTGWIRRKGTKVWGLSKGKFGPISTYGSASSTMSTHSPELS